MSNLETIANRESKQIKTEEDFGSPRTFLKNSSTIKAFASLSKKFGSELHLCTDLVHREYLRMGGKSSEQSDAFRAGANDIIAIFLECEDTIYQEEKKDEKESDDVDE